MCPVANKTLDLRDGSGEAVCTGDCNVSSFQCRPVSCGFFSTPSNSVVIRNTQWDNLRSSSFVKDNFTAVLYEDIITVECVENHRLLTMPSVPTSTSVLLSHMDPATCSHRSFRVLCNETGKLEYTHTSTERVRASLLSPSCQTCVPVQCPVATLNATNGYTVPLRGSVLYDHTASVVCNAGYRVKPRGYQGRYALCKHATNYSYICNGSICQFQLLPEDAHASQMLNMSQNDSTMHFSPACARLGCAGHVAYYTSDGRFPLSFERQGALISTSIDGQLTEGETINVTCPVGYRVQATSPAQASSPRFAKAVCGSDCSITRVQCQRITCGNFTVPANSMASRDNSVPGISGGTEVDTLLYGETVTVSCVENHRLGAAGMNCSQRGFRVRCGDEGQLEYEDGMASLLFPARQTCVPIQCNLSTVDDSNGVRYPANGSLVVGQTAMVTCNAGFHVALPFGKGKRLPIKSDTTVFTISCTNECSISPSPKCQHPGCWGLSSNKTADLSLLITYAKSGQAVDLTAPGQLAMGETAQVKCPKGFNFAGQADFDLRDPTGFNTSTTSSLPSSTPPTSSTVPNTNGTVGCMKDGNISAFECRRVVCGDFHLPRNSTGTWLNTTTNKLQLFQEGLIPNLKFGESLTISCVANHHILSTSSWEDCYSSMTVFCNAEGRFESTVLDKPILQPTAFVCAPSPKQVFCAPCYRYWATDPEANQVKFPAFAALDCTAGMCDPASGRRSYQLPAEDRWLGMRCPSVTNSTVSPCLRVLCRPLLQVDIGSNAEILYNISGYNAYNVSAPPPECGRAVTIKCRDGLVPERSIGVASMCSETTFQMICNGRGFWQGFQKCVKKMCVVNETLFSNLVPVGSTHSPSCPIGFEVAQADKSSICQNNCLMSSVKTCRELQCIYNNNSGDSRVRGPTARARVGGNISMRCLEDFITFDGSATCNQDYVATCQADGKFDRQGMCVRASCEPYTSIDTNVNADQLTTRTTGKQEISRVCGESVLEVPSSIISIIEKENVPGH